MAHVGLQGVQKYAAWGMPDGPKRWCVPCGKKIQGAVTKVASQKSENMCEICKDRQA